MIGHWLVVGEREETNIGQIERFTTDDCARTLIEVRWERDGQVTVLPAWAAIEATNAALYADETEAREAYQWRAVPPCFRRWTPGAPVGFRWSTAMHPDPHAQGGFQQCSGHSLRMIVTIDEEKHEQRVRLMARAAELQR